MLGIPEIAAAAVTVLSPYIPVLTGALQKGGEELAKWVAQKGGELAWNKAQEVWKKITGSLGNDPGVTGAAAVLAEDPSDEGFQTALAKLLTKRMENNPDLVKELEAVLGGAAGVQKIVTGENAIVKNVRQAMKGSGKQDIEIGRGGRAGDLTQEQG
jgi:hypothetical protein